MPLASVSLNVKKTFDHLEWDFIIGFLMKLNIGQYFMKAIQYIYQKLTARVQLNHFESTSFPLTEEPNKEPSPYSLLSH